MLDKGWECSSVGSMLTKHAWVPEFDLQHRSGVHACNSSHGEVAAERPECQCHLWLCSNEASLSYRRPCGGNGGIEEALKGKDWGIVLVKNIP